MCVMCGFQKAKSYFTWQVGNQQKLFGFNEKQKFGLVAVDTNKLTAPSLVSLKNAIRRTIEIVGKTFVRGHTALFTTKNNVREKVTLVTGKKTRHK